MRYPVTFALFALLISSSVYAQQPARKIESTVPSSYEQVLQTLFEGTGPENSKAGSATSATPSAAAPAKAGKLAHRRAVVNYDIYRDFNPLPVDPRKPCQPCTTRQKDCGKRCCLDNVTGYKGQPWKEREPGGCDCGKKNKHPHPLYSVYWPSPASGIFEEHCPRLAARRAATFDRFKLRDVFDHLGGFEVSKYQRRDNGYCGHGRDRFGCLGESRQLQSRVFGVGFIEPGQPVPRGGVPFP